LEEQQPGVYRCRWGTDSIQVVVLRQLARAERNAPLHLLSAAPELVQFGQEHYRPRSQDTSSLLLRLFQGYQGEGLAMPYTMEDFRRDFAKSFLKDLPPEERREALKGLSAEERLEDLSVAEIEKLLEKRKAEGTSRPRKGRRRG
jgi:hypothetical protein